MTRQFLRCYCMIKKGMLKNGWDPYPKIKHTHICTSHKNVSRSVLHSGSIFDSIDVLFIVALHLY